MFAIFINVTSIINVCNCAWHNHAFMMMEDLDVCEPHFLGIWWQEKRGKFNRNKRSCTYIVQCVLLSCFYTFISINLVLNREHTVKRHHFYYYRSEACRPYVYTVKFALMGHLSATLGHPFLPLFRNIAFKWLTKPWLGVLGPYLRAVRQERARNGRPKVANRCPAWASFPVHQWLLVKRNQNAEHANTGCASTGSL